MADAEQWCRPEMWERHKPKFIVRAVGIDHGGFSYRVPAGRMIVSFGTVFIVPRACVDS